MENVNKKAVPKMPKDPPPLQPKTLPPEVAPLLPRTENNAQPIRRNKNENNADLDRMVDILRESARHVNPDVLTRKSRYPCVYYVSVMVLFVICVFIFQQTYQPLFSFYTTKETKTAPLMATSMHASGHKGVLIPYRTAHVPMISADARAQLTTYLNIEFPGAMCNTSDPSMHLCLIHLPKRITFRPLVSWNPYIHVLEHTHYGIVATVIFANKRPGQTGCTENDTWCTQGQTQVADIKGLIDAYIEHTPMLP